MFIFFLLVELTPSFIPRFQSHPFDADRTCWSRQTLVDSPMQLWTKQAPLSHSFFYLPLFNDLPLPHFCSGDQVLIFSFSFSCQQFSLADSVNLLLFVDHPHALLIFWRHRFSVLLHSTRPLCWYSGVYRELKTAQFSFLILHQVVYQDLSFQQNRIQILLSFLLAFIYILG